LIACSDSRVVPNLFASTEPGDLFGVRNVGNVVSPCGLDGISAIDESEAAAIELAALSLKVSHVIVFGRKTDDSPAHVLFLLDRAAGRRPAQGDDAMMQNATAGRDECLQCDGPAKLFSREPLFRFSVLTVCARLEPRRAG